jgi:hypothetical protein
MANVLQRFVWTGKPQELAVWWTLRRGGRAFEAICRMFPHEFGFELRLEIAGELISSQVCRNDDEVLTCQETWRAGLEAKAWTK